MNSAGAGARLGITASRRVGNAVARNGVKRRVREWFRRLPQRPDVDWVVIARPGAGRQSGAQVARDLDVLAARLARQATA